MKRIIFLPLLAVSLATALAQDEDPLLALRMLLLDGEHEQLLSITDTLEVDDTLAARVYYYRGRAYQSLFSYDSAYHYYQLAHRADSADLSYRVSMGGMLSKLGRVREGRSWMKETSPPMPGADGQALIPRGEGRKTYCDRFGQMQMIMRLRRTGRS